MPPIIAYNLASSSIKSSLLLSLTSKVTTSPFATGIVVVEDIDSAGIAVEDIVVVYIAQADTKPVLIQIAFAHHFSLSNYPLFSLAVAEMLYSPFYHDLLIYKIYNKDYLVCLQYSVSIDILWTCGP